MSEKLSIGGQALIEGVMIRSPKKLAMAARRPSGEIAVKVEDFIPVTKRKKILGLPVIRGFVTFFEMLIVGIKALNWSAEVALSEGKQEKRRSSDIYLFGVLVLALAFGLLLFFYTPILLSTLLGFRSNPVIFNIVAGFIRALLVVGYIVAISFMKDIRRVFEYHGAEHKSVFAFEKERNLSLEAARRYPTLHPRCGTSFLLFVVLVSIIVFALSDSLFFVIFSRAQVVWERFLTHLIFLPLVAGASFELLKLSDAYPENPMLRLFSYPGLLLQRITTREPDDLQLEVALTACKKSLEGVIPEEDYVKRDT
ncbi:DUF1385 domain-containing protein [bacterium]|nr:DUF1385 domain-containing protein [bacterium]